MARRKTGGPTRLGRPSKAVIGYSIQLEQIQRQKIYQELNSAQDRCPECGASGYTPGVACPNCEFQDGYSDAVH